MSQGNNLIPVHRHAYLDWRIFSFWRRLSNNMPLKQFATTGSYVMNWITLYQQHLKGARNLLNELRFQCLWQDTFSHKLRTKITKQKGREKENLYHSKLAIWEMLFTIDSYLIKSIGNLDKNPIAEGRKRDETT